MLSGMDAASPAVFLTVWRSMLLGLGLIAIAAICGWNVATSTQFQPVRILGWWMSRVIIPQLQTPSWFHRAFVIFTNNIIILAILMILSAWPLAAIIAVGAVGLSMGVALRILNDRPVAFLEPQEDANAPISRRVRFGVMLNCLEPFAIIAAVGMAMGRTHHNIDATDAWRLFAVWIVPPMLIAAAGESLWIGERLRANTKT